MTEKFMDTDFLETQGLFSINPKQVTNIEYFENDLYFFFNNSDLASMRLKFRNETDARQSLEGFKIAVAKKSIDYLESED